LKIAYGIGQFINGQLAERIRPRVLLALGMISSAVLNLIFGLGTGFYFLLFVWAMNGYSQSLGWTSCMRVAKAWFPASRRGRGLGVIGTGIRSGGRHGRGVPEAQERGGGRAGPSRATRRLTAVLTGR